MFTTGTTDNIDVSGRNEMHGTSITMIGHVTNDNPGEKRPKLDLKIEDEAPLTLPEEYINVPFIEDCGDEFRLKSIPEGKGSSSACKNISTEENSWLCHVRNSRKKDENDKWQLPATPVTFSGYFSKKTKQRKCQSTVYNRNFSSIYRGKGRFIKYAKACHDCS